MKKYSILLLILPLIGKAQNNGDSIKFEMIKATVFFYATDTAFKIKNPKIPDCVSLDYTCLTEYCKTNSLKGVDGKIKNWMNERSSGTKELQALKAKIIGELTKEDRIYRKKLPGFDNLINNLNSLEVSFEEKAPISTTSIQQDPNVKTKNLQIPESTAKDSSSSSLLTWLAFLAGLGGLGLSIFLITNKPKKKKSESDSANNGLDIGKLENRIAVLNTQLAFKADKTAMDSFDQRIAALENFVKNNDARAKVEMQETKPSVVKTQQAPSILEFFAKMADLPNGFSNDILKSEQNGEQVFEIIVRDNTATYTVSSDDAAQGYALNDFNYILNRACTLQNQPFSNCQIITKQNGTLTKTNEGWQIQNKAIVEFK